MASSRAKFTFTFKRKCSFNIGEDNHGNMSVIYMSAEKHIIVAITVQQLLETLMSKMQMDAIGCF
jgi:hypothetical protein